MCANLWLVVYICSFWSDEPHWMCEVKSRRNRSANVYVFPVSIVIIEKQTNNRVCQLATWNGTFDAWMNDSRGGEKKNSLQIFLHWCFRSKRRESVAQLSLNIKIPASWKWRTLNNTTSSFDWSLDSGAHVDIPLNRNHHPKILSVQLVSRRTICQCCRNTSFLVVVVVVGDHSKKMTRWFDKDCLPAHKNRTIPGSLAS